MTRKESEKYIKSKMCNNCGVYLGGGKCSDNCNVIEAIQALSQEPLFDKLTEIIEPLRHLSFDEMSDVEWQMLRVIDKYKAERRGKE